MVDGFILAGLEIVLDGRVKRQLTRPAVIAFTLFLARPGEMVADEEVARALRDKKCAGSARAIRETMDDLTRVFSSLQLSHCWRRHDHSGWVYTPLILKGSGKTGGADGDWEKGTPTKPRRRDWLCAKFDFPMVNTSLLREGDRTR